MKTTTLLSSILVACILITSCKKNKSSNSSQQSSIIGNWKIISDSTYYYPFSNSGQLASSTAVLISPTDSIDFFPNGLEIFKEEADTLAAPYKDTSSNMYKLIANNGIVYIDPYGQQSGDTSIAILLTAHNAIIVDNDNYYLNGINWSGGDSCDKTVIYLRR